MKFTIEHPGNNSLSFLDTTVTLSQTGITTNWYRKPTWSGRYLNFNSSQPLKYKVYVVNRLVDRALLLSD